MPRALLSVVALVALSAATNAQEPVPAKAAPGHFVLVVSGDRLKVQVTYVSRKPTECGAVPKGLRSDWTVSIRGAEDKVLETRPLDMSKFDLRPGSRGTPDRVNGCEVISSRIEMLVNVPDLAGAERIVFLDGKRIVGSITIAEARRLAAEVRR